MNSNELTINEFGKVYRLTEREKIKLMQLLANKEATFERIANILDILREPYD